MNPSKTISANSKGIVITFGDVNKHQFVYYNNRNNTIKEGQLAQKAKYQNVEHVQFNKIQKRLFNQALYGLKCIPNEVLMEMRTEAIRNIHKNHLKAKEVLNNYKQEVSNNQLNSLLSKLLPKSPIVKQLLTVNDIDSSMTCTLSFRDLNITSKMIAEKLIQFNVLPENFFKLA